MTRVYSESLLKQVFCRWVICGLILTAAGCGHQAASPGPALSAEAHAGLHPIAYADMIWNGVTTTADGRMFVVFPHNDGGQGLRIAEVQDGGELKAYPDQHWNDYKTGDDPAHKFVGANALRIGPDGNLWVVDTGTTGAGTKVVVGGPKIVVVDVKTDAVLRTIPMDWAVKPDSFIDDIRFNGRHAYITDAGAPAIIVLDIATGQGRRTLENDPSTTDNRPIKADGQVLHKTDGSDFHLNADQLEVSPDGKTFYFQPCSGPMYCVDTASLDDENLPPAALSAKVKSFFDAPSTGGTTIDADGNIYLSDVDHQRILKIKPDGSSTVLVESKVLEWGDAMWIDDHGNLLIPAAQLDRSAPMQQGISRVQWPVMIFALPIDAKPLRN